MRSETPDQATPRQNDVPARGTDNLTDNLGNLVALVVLILSVIGVIWQSPLFWGFAYRILVLVLLGGIFARLGTLTRYRDKGHEQ